MELLGCESGASCDGERLECGPNLIAIYQAKRLLEVNQNCQEHARRCARTKPRPAPMQTVPSDNFSYDCKGISSKPTRHSPELRKR
eukprot:4634935-Pyramimonas_sp.AAC.1